MRLSTFIDFMKLRGKQKSTALSNKTKYDVMEDVSDVFHGYNYYINFLSEKIIKIIEWDNLPSTIPNDALQDYVIHNGYAGIVSNDKYGFLAVPCSKYGVGLYPRYEPLALYSTPLAQGSDLVIGRDIVIVKNNSYQLSFDPFIKRYARQMADIDATLNIALSNYRMPFLPSFDNEDSAESYKAAMIANRLGQVDSVVDRSFLAKGEFTPLNQSMATGKLLDIVSTRNELLRSFLAEIGVMMANDKKERMVVDEVNSSQQMLLFNVSDMLECQRKASEEANRVFGLNTSVHLSQEYRLIDSTNDVVESEGEKENENTD